MGLALVGAPTSVSLYIADDRPTAVAGLEPVALGTATEPRLVLDVDAATGSFLVVWLTALPQESGGLFRGALAEVVVRGE